VIGLKKKHKTSPTMLNEYDRKILDKYAGFNTNFIESNTADVNIFDNKFNNPKK